MNNSTSPHTKSVRKSANRSRSCAINTVVHEATNGVQMQRLGYTALSSESSTCSSRGTADARHYRRQSSISILEAKSAFKSSIDPSPLISNRSASSNHNLKLKTSTPKDVPSIDGAANDIGTNVCSSNFCNDINTANPVVTRNKACSGGGMMKVEEVQIISGCANLNMEDVVCSMCGDVGIAELLFVCSKCSNRHQHIYCSRSYPNVRESEASICNWCLHAEDAREAAKVSSDALYSDNAAQTVDFDGAKTSRVPQGRGLLDHGMKEEEGDREGEEDMMVKKGHTKAFEYLLLVAAVQYLPLDSKAISNANAENRQGNQATSPPAPNSSTKRASTAVGKGISQQTDMGIKANSSTSTLVNVVNMDPLKGANKTNASLLSNRLSVGLATNENSRAIHAPFKSSLNQKNDMDIDRFIGGGIPKRQRCASKGFNASLKCRKKGLQLSPSRPNYRRYKLLADVVC